MEHEKAYKYESEPIPLEMASALAEHWGCDITDERVLHPTECGWPTSYADFRAGWDAATERRSKNSLADRIEVLQSLAQRQCPMPDGPPYCDDNGTPCLSCMVREELGRIGELADNAFLMLRDVYNWEKEEE